MRIKKTVITVISSMMLALVLSFGVKMDSEAAATVKNLKQTDGYDTMVRVDWSTANATTDTYYLVEYRLSGSTTWIVEDDELKSASSNYVYLNSLQSGKTYYVRITPVEATGYDLEDIYDKGASASVEVVTAPTAKVGTVKSTKLTSDAVTLKWSAVSGANYYIIKGQKESKLSSNYVDIETSSKSNAVTIKVGKYKRFYLSSVRPCRISSTGFIAQGTATYESKSFATVPAKLYKAAFRYYPYSGSLYIEDNVCYSDGIQYQLYKVGDNNKKTKIKSGNFTDDYGKIENSQLGYKKNQVIMVRARAYVTDTQGKAYCGGWSDWQYFAPEPEKVYASSTSKGIKLAWTKIKGADRYVIYGSNSKKESSLKKIAYTTKTSATIQKINNAKVKKGKYYYFYILPQKKIGNKYVNVAEMTGYYRVYCTKSAK